MKIGIKAKLNIFMAILLFVVISILSSFVLNGIKSYQDREVLNILFKQKDMFEQYFSEKINETGSYDKPQLMRGTIFNKPWLRNIPASLYDTNGNILSGFDNESNSEENQERKEMIQIAINKLKCPYKRYENTIYFYSPLIYKGNTIAILELKYSIQDRVDFYNNIKKMFVVMGLCSLLIGIGCGIVYFSKFTNDIYIMRNYVNDIQNGNFTTTKPIDRSDELGELSSGLICMSNTIEKNISDLQVERDSLSMAVEKLKKMSKEQKEFIGSVTHEFKTPITAIKAFGDLIGMYPDDLDLIEDGTKKISKECDRLSGLVENVLNLSALEKYDFEMEKKEVNLKEILLDICERMSGRIDRNNLTLEHSLEDIVIFIDEESLRHVVINLVDNAIKYSKANSVINVNCYTQNERACIEVCDSGIGIDEVHLSRIFEPFYRVDKNRSRKAGGAGLGLSLVKKLVVKQGGEIKVFSKINEGTKFYIEFPL